MQESSCPNMCGNHAAQVVTVFREIIQLLEARFPEAVQIARRHSRRRGGRGFNQFLIDQVCMACSGIAEARQDLQVLRVLRNKIEHERCSATFYNLRWAIGLQSHVVSVTSSVQDWTNSLESRQSPN